MEILKIDHLRFISRFIIESDTPLTVASGENDTLTGACIATDSNGLPMIPGTSLKGLLRYAFSIKESDKDLKSLFGYQGEKVTVENVTGENDGAGARLIVSNAHLIGDQGETIEGLHQIDTSINFYQKFSELPVRQHCRINLRGAADTSEHGKFDEQVVYKGTRFCFEMELAGSNKDKKFWDSLLKTFADKSFRIGGGTRNGFGSIKIISLESACFDLLKPDGLMRYLEKSSSLNTADCLEKEDIPQNLESKDWLEYRLSLEPDDFYCFGSGFGDSDVDITPVYEEFIGWTEDGKPDFQKRQILIPATSVKGAISHRVAFHYNKLVKDFADDKSEKPKKITGTNNKAVKALFGCEKDSNNNEPGRKGNVIFSDCFILKTAEGKIINHVAIDRFTGGALDGALFNEKVIDQKDKIELSFLVNKESLKDVNIKTAFENTLNDICDGMLPLGGGVMRGHGVFFGQVIKKGE